MASLNLLDQILHAPPLEHLKDAALTRLNDVELKIRSRLGGNDASHTKEALRSRQMARYHDLFDILDYHGTGLIPVDEFEDLFGAAGLLVARTEVGSLTYDVDEDGNGALDFQEFVQVMDKMNEYNQGKIAATIGDQLNPEASRKRQREHERQLLEMEVDTAGGGAIVGESSSADHLFDGLRSGSSSSSSGAAGQQHGLGEGKADAAVATGASDSGSVGTAAVVSPLLIAQRILEEEAERKRQEAWGSDGEEGSFLFGTEGAALSLRQVIFRTLDEPTFSPFARVMAIIMSVTVIAAILTFVLETEPYFASFLDLFGGIEAFCVIVFIGDFGTRFATCPNYYVFCTSVFNWIDLITIVPFFLDEVNSAFHPKDAGFGTALRIMRILRIFRIFRITKYIPYVNLMTGALQSSLRPLALASLVLAIGILLLAMAAFYAERGIWDPEQGVWINSNGGISPLQDVTTSVYWCIASLTTVGYGETFPITAAGKVVGSICCLMGCIIISFPVAIYTDEFAKLYNEFEKKRALQGELGGEDLVQRLLRTTLRELRTAVYPRFPARGDPRAYRSIAQPRNIQLMRWARGTDEELRAAREEQIKRRADVKPIAGRVAAAAAEAERVAASGNPLNSDEASLRAFSDIWTILKTKEKKGGAFSLKMGGKKGDKTKGGDGYSSGKSLGSSGNNSNSSSGSDSNMNNMDEDGDGEMIQKLARAGNIGSNEEAPLTTLPDIELSSIPASQWPTMPPLSAADVRAAVSEPREGGAGGVNGASSASTSSTAAASIYINLLQSMAAKGGEEECCRSASEALAVASPRTTSAAAIEHFRVSGRILPFQGGSSSSSSSSPFAPPGAATTSEGKETSREAALQVTTSPENAVGAATAHPSTAAAASDPAFDQLVKLAKAARKARQAFQRSHHMKQARGHANSIDFPDIVDLVGGGEGEDVSVDPSSSSSPLASSSASSPPPPPQQLDASGFILQPESFNYLDLSFDDQVSQALLALLSDHRRRVWSEVRALEAKFRDDLNVEVARRWQTWMRLPQESVARVASPFVFRKGHLAASLSFSRDQLRMGPVSQHGMEQTLAGVGGGQIGITVTSRGASDRGSFDLSQSNPSKFEGFLSPQKKKPSKAASGSTAAAGSAPPLPPFSSSSSSSAASFLHESSEKLLHLLPTALQDVLSGGAVQQKKIAHNYQARLADKYADVLGSDLPSHLQFHAVDDDKVKAAAASVRGQQQPSEAAGVWGTATSTNSSATGRAGEEDDNEETFANYDALSYSTTGSDKHKGNSAANEGDTGSGYDQTAYGVSKRAPVDSTK